MEVLDILKKNGAELYPEDLAFFEAELDTGDYSIEYIDACKKLIGEIRAWKKQATAQNSGDSGIPGNVFVDKDKLAPGAAKPLTEKERLSQITHDIAQMRTASNYKTRFKQYLADHPALDEAFIDQNIALFMPWELDAIWKNTSPRWTQRRLHAISFSAKSFSSSTFRSWTLKSC